MSRLQKAITVVLVLAGLLLSLIIRHGLTGRYMLEGETTYCDFQGTMFQAPETVYIGFVFVVSVNCLQTNSLYRFNWNGEYYLFAVNTTDTVRILPAPSVAGMYILTLEHFLANKWIKISMVQSIEAKVGRI